MATAPTDEPTQISLSSLTSRFREHSFLGEFFDYCDGSRPAAHRHFVLVKKHKCASTSIQYLLHRVAQKHRLLVARPPAASFIGGYPGKFNPHFIASELKTGKFDVILHHMRFDRKEIDKVMHDDTVYIRSVFNDDSKIVHRLKPYFFEFHF